MFGEQDPNPIKAVKLKAGTNPEEHDVHFVLSALTVHVPHDE